jgi:hypothetical protein
VTCIFVSRYFLLILRASCVNLIFDSMQHNAATKKIDHSHGRVKLLNGHIFYSPNSPKNGGLVILPQSHDPDLHIFTIRNGKPQIQYHDLLLLCWYAPRTVCLSFLMLNPITVGYPFNWLAHISVQGFVNGKYTLKVKGQDSW